MNGSADGPPFRRLAPRYVTAYLCWFALAALGLWAALQLRLGAVAIVFRTVARDRARDSVTASGQVRSLDNLITVVLVLVWLGGTVLLEAHLREAVPAARLRVRAGAVLAALLALLALAYTLQALP